MGAWPPVSVVTPLAACTVDCGPLPTAFKGFFDDVRLGGLEPGTALGFGPLLSYIGFR